MKISRRGINPHERGQGTLEFALVFPIFLFLILAIIEIAHLMFFYNSVAVASLEASRFGAGMGPSGTTGLSNWQDCQGIRDAAKRIGTVLGLQDSDIQISFEDAYGNPLQTVDSNGNSVAPCTGSSGSIKLIGLGYWITVKVTAHYEPLVPLININPVTVTTKSSHTILTNVPVGEY